MNRRHFLAGVLLAPVVAAAKGLVPKAPSPPVPVPDHWQLMYLGEFPPRQMYVECSRGAYKTTWSKVLQDLAEHPELVAPGQVDREKVREAWVKAGGEL